MSKTPKPTATGKSSRLLALDILRGITVAGMILVNNPGSWGHIYAPLEHAEWNGLTPTDLVFPFFMFIMGVSTYFSLAEVQLRIHWKSRCQNPPPHRGDIPHRNIHCLVLASTLHGLLGDKRFPRRRGLLRPHPHPSV